MQNKYRNWKISRVDSPHELASLITSTKFPVWQGFLLDNYLFLNDSQYTSQAVYAACRQCTIVGSLMFQSIHQLAQLDFTGSTYIECMDEIAEILTGSKFTFSDALDTIDYARLILR